MFDKTNINIKKTLLAFLVSLVTIPPTRFILPQTVIDGSLIRIAWLPISVMSSVIFIFGHYAVAPLVLAFAITNSFLIESAPSQALILLFCQLFAVFVSCAALRLMVGKRWRCGPTAKHMGTRIFWGGFFASVLLKITMYLAGQYFAFLLSITSYFGSMPLIYTVIDIQSLISVASIFMTSLYYPMRMIISPRYARRFWRQECLPQLAPKHRSSTLYWFISPTFLLILLRAPYQSESIVGYLVPAMSIIYFIRISRIGHALLCTSWSVSTLLLMVYSKNFLQGVQSEYSLSFVLSVLIPFTIYLFYTADTYARSDRNKRRWRSQVGEGPLTGLPNLRALVSYLRSSPLQAICSPHIDNLDFFSRHHGLVMDVDCERQIIRALQPLLGATDKIFQVPGGELILVLDGPDPAARLNHMVAILNHKKFNWYNQPLDLKFSAAWSRDDSQGETLHQMLGQLNWLSEQAGSERRILALDEERELVADQTTEQVRLLMRVKRALKERALVLYAQPIQNTEGEGYHEILMRMRCGDGVIMPGQFISLIVQLNLSQRFDILVLETLFSSLHQHPGQQFSVNLLPSTLMQEDSAAQIIALFQHYRISPDLIIIEVTEEQAFSNADTSQQNLDALRAFDCAVAIDGFGTGHANYERLKHLQTDIIKIDGCFVRDILTDPLDAIVVKSIVEMARAKQMSVVAEYVESEPQKARLLELGVNYLQGYLVGKPQPLGE